MEGTVTMITSSSFYGLLLHLSLFLKFYEISLPPLFLSQGGIKNKNQNSNQFSLKVCFLHGGLQLILGMLRMLCKLHGVAFGQLSGKGEGGKGTAPGRLRLGYSR